ncbi:MAG: TIR domain-containing protein [Planctomycetes bacterium]|nr:TIR domain-containing protein [Planctomycetota bacterium]
MGHKCFISFKTEDIAYKNYIQSGLDVDMIDKSLNNTIDSEDEDYILQKIREDYLSDSTVTIHIIGVYSAENLGHEERKFIKRELQASLYNGEGNTRSGILGLVLPSVESQIYKESFNCPQCGSSHNHVAINGSTVVSEFSYNYYIPNDKCCHTEDERYCVLVKWGDFCANPEKYIDDAFNKRSEPIANKVKVYGT